ncbi:hypothetical protein QJQ45_007563 [Haematococcus lacustris]|nr:hypothetical protein QJQ45_007563 [Haematococcus lacustris]
MSRVYRMSSMLPLLLLLPLRVFGPEGAQVVCDSVSLDLLRGARIEWEESLMRSAFVVGSNPNSEASCGCGSSFTAKAITPPTRQRAGKAS